MSQPVSRAVIPAAGLGTRFLPVTHSIPKALIPILAKPLIHYAVAEAAAAGISEIAIVVSPSSRNVVDYFRPDPGLQKYLNERGGSGLLREQNELASAVTVTGIVQEEPLGLGDAVLAARSWVGDQRFAVLLPDDLMWSHQPVIGQLMDEAASVDRSILACKRVSPETVPNVGIIEPGLVSGRRIAVKSVVEKPELSDAPSDLAIIGRYLLPPSIFSHLEEASPGARGEIQLTDAIGALMETEEVYAWEIDGLHIDAGTPLGVFQAILHEARQVPEMAALLAQEDQPDPNQH